MHTVIFKMLIRIRKKTSQERVLLHNKTTQSPLKRCFILQNTCAVRKSAQNADSIRYFMTFSLRNLPV